MDSDSNPGLMASLEKKNGKRHDMGSNPPQVQDFHTEGERWKRGAKFGEHVTPLSQDMSQMEIPVCISLIELFSRLSPSPASSFFNAPHGMSADSKLCHWLVSL